METVIVYADVLFLYNFVMNCLILCLVAFVSHRRFFWGRGAVASGVGSLYSCLLMLESFLPAEHLVFRLLISAFMVFTAFRVHRFREFLKLFVLFYLMNFTLAGGIRFSETFGVSSSGQISLMAVCLGILFLALFGQLYIGFLQKKAVCPVKTVTLTHQGKQLSLRAFPDTGNTLTEPIGHASVIVVKEQLLKDFLGTGEPEQVKRFRWIPCSTVTDGEGMLWGFQPDSVTCEEKPLRAVVAASDSLVDADYDAVFNPVILIS